MDLFGSAASESAREEKGRKIMLRVRGRREEEREMRWRLAVSGSLWRGWLKLVVMSEHMNSGRELRRTEREGRQF